MLGQATAATGAGSLGSILNSTNYEFLGGIGTTNSSAVAAEAAQYVLSNIGFNIVRMDMPAYFYKAMANVLASGVYINNTIQILKFSPVKVQLINQEPQDFL